MQLTAFIHARWNKWNKSFDYSLHACDMTEYGYILLEEQELFFESPTEKELKVKAAFALRQQKNAILGKAAAEAQEIEQDITELLAIEYKPTEISDDIPF